MFLTWGFHEVGDQMKSPHPKHLNNWFLHNPYANYEIRSVYCSLAHYMYIPFSGFCFLPTRMSYDQLYITIDKHGQSETDMAVGHWCIRDHVIFACVACLTSHIAPHAGMQMTRCEYGTQWLINQRCIQTWLKPPASTQQHQLKWQCSARWYIIAWIQWLWWIGGIFYIVGPTLAF